MAGSKLPTAPAVKHWLRTFKPRRTHLGRVEFFRGALGGLLGILAASAVGKWLNIDAKTLPFIVAPIGASAVLLFAAPASPLAQPWQVIVGNVSSGIVGVTTGKLFHDPMLAAAAGVGGAIAVMMLLRCVHPPGGACALFAAVAAPAVHKHGYAFAVFPLGINTVIVVVVAIVVNNLTGRRYPHVPEAEPAKATVGATGAVSELPPSGRVGVQTADIERAMARLDQGLDIMPADVMVLVHNAEVHALDRRLGELRCESIMVRDVQTIEPTNTLYRARLLINEHHVKALVVVDADRHVVGIITVFDLFNLDVADIAPVSSVMSSPVTTLPSPLTP